MNKKEVIREVAKKAGITQAEARRIVEITLGVISDQLKSGDEVKLNGFGHFSVKETEYTSKVQRDTLPNVRSYIKTRPTFKASKMLQANVRIAGEDSSDPDKTNDPAEFIKGIRK